MCCHIRRKLPFKITHWLLCRPWGAFREPWSFFHFWSHHFWPKLASSILNFYRRKRSFQWSPDQSDRPNEAEICTKMPQKVERKTQSKIPCHYAWLPHGINCPSLWRFLRSFLTASKLSRRSIPAAKKGKTKTNSKIEKPKEVGHCLVSKFWFLQGALVSANARAKMS